MKTEIQVMNEEFEEICKEHASSVYRYEVIADKDGELKGYKDFINKIYIPYINNR